MDKIVEVSKFVPTIWIPTKTRKSCHFHNFCKYFHISKRLLSSQKLSAAK